MIRWRADSQTWSSIVTLFLATISMVGCATSPKDSLYLGEYVLVQQTTDGYESSGQVYSDVGSLVTALKAIGHNKVLLGNQTEPTIGEILSFAANLNQAGLTAYVLDENDRPLEIILDLDE